MDPVAIGFLLPFRDSCSLNERMYSGLGYSSIQWYYIQTRQVVILSSKKFNAEVPGFQGITCNFTALISGHPKIFVREHWQPIII